MNPVVALLLIAFVAVLGYVIPKKYNKYFYNTYHEKAVSLPLANATAVLISLWLLFMDLDGFWYWSLLIASILLCIASVIHAIYIGLQVRASVLEVVIAVFAQILAIAGMVILLIGFIAFIFECLGGKKKKRK